MGYAPARGASRVRRCSQGRGAGRARSSATSASPLPGDLAARSNLPAQAVQVTCCPGGITRLWSPATKLRDWRIPGPLRPLTDADGAQMLIETEGGRHSPPRSFRRERHQHDHDRRASVRGSEGRGRPQQPGQVGGRIPHQFQDEPNGFRACLRFLKPAGITARKRPSLLVTPADDDVVLDGLSS